MPLRLVTEESNRVFGESITPCIRNGMKSKSPQFKCNCFASECTLGTQKSMRTCAACGNVKWMNEYAECNYFVSAGYTRDAVNVHFDGEVPHLCTWTCASLQVSCMHVFCSHIQSFWLLRETIGVRIANLNYFHCNLFSTLFHLGCTHKWKVIHFVLPCKLRHLCACRHATYSCWTISVILPNTAAR